MVGTKVEEKQAGKSKKWWLEIKGYSVPKLHRVPSAAPRWCLFHVIVWRPKARVQLKEVRNVCRPCSVERGVSGPGYYRNSRRSHAERSQGRNPPRQLLPSGKCLFHKAGLVRSREEVKGLHSGNLRPNSVCFVRQMPWLHSVGVVSPPWWAQVWHRKWDINSLIPGPWEQTGGTETTNWCSAWLIPGDCFYFQHKTKTSIKQEKFIQLKYWARAGCT